MSKDLYPDRPVLSALERAIHALYDQESTSGLTPDVLEDRDRCTEVLEQERARICVKENGGDPKAGGSGHCSICSFYCHGKVVR